MDTKSLHKLEFNKVIDKVVTYTSFSGGADLVRQMNITTDIDEAITWQKQTAEAKQLLENHTHITIGGTRDVRKAVSNSKRGYTLQGEELLNIRATLVAARELKRNLLKLEEGIPTLADIAELIEEVPGLITNISQTFDERGGILDSASPKLTRIRQDLRKVHGRIQDKLQSILSGKESSHLQESLISLRGGRYVIPVKAESRGRIRGIVHDQSSSGATIWVEPMATVDLNNEYRRLQLEEQEEIQRILAELSRQVAEHSDPITRITERMAELDHIFARAKYAMYTDAVEPDFVAWRTFSEPRPPKHANERAKWTPPPRNPHPGSTIWVKGARHPLLEPDNVVPTDFTLDEETFIVLITGPNTGGKTVSLKNIALMVLMAQSGLHLPVTEARLSIFEQVFADIGDEQSIEQSLSTFSGHVTNIVRLLDGVDDRSLVVLDELGSGTDPSEGAALAQAITNYLLDKGTTTFIATHYPELKAYASQTRGAVNASLVFDVDTLSPTYEMTIGIPGRSNALAIAQRLGMDETILQDARQLLGRDSYETENMLDSLYALRDKIESQEAKTRITLRKAEMEREQLLTRLEKIEEERQRVIEEARTQAREELEAAQSEIRRAQRRIQDADESAALKRNQQRLAELSDAQAEPIEAKLVQPKPKPTIKKPSTLQVGDKVKVKSLDVKGEISEVLSKNEVMVTVGRLQMRSKIKDLEFTSRPADNPAPEEVFVATTSSRRGSVPLELDIRGARVDTGLRELEKYLDNAFLARMPWVRIIHGKGTGKLRTAVRQALKHNHHVLSWEEGKDGEGGAGVTVAKLKE